MFHYLTVVVLLVVERLTIEAKQHVEHCPWEWNLSSYNDAEKENEIFANTSTSLQRFRCIFSVLFSSFSKPRMVKKTSNVNVVEQNVIVQSCKLL